jgi:hypothetical protein
MIETLEAPATAWVARFEELLRETLPHLRRIAPELSEETLIQFASQLVELRLGGRHGPASRESVNRCVAIYPTGTIASLPANPATHRRLRGLGYTRFLVKLEREGDSASFSTPVYAISQPSRVQLTDVAAQLWGLGAERIRVFDETGELLDAE